MKTFCCAFLLMASMAFVLLGCSDNSGPVAASNEQVTAPSNASSLAKGGPVVHSVTGSSLLRFFDKMGTLTIAAHQYEDATVDGTYNWVTTGAFHPGAPWGGHGEVKYLTFYNSTFGNAVVICGLEREKSSLANKYLVWFLVDNPSGPDACSEFVQSGSSDIHNMTPDQIYALFPYLYVSEEGNLTIR